MSSKEEIAIRQEILDRTLTRWQEVEEETIANANVLIEKSQSTLVKQVMRLVLRDSEKHRELLQTLLGVLHGTITMTPDELGEISELLEKHKQIENESIILANAALEHTTHYVMRQLLTYMLEDERKHLLMTEQVQEYKRRIYPG